MPKIPAFYEPHTNLSMDETKLPIGLCHKFTKVNVIFGSLSSFNGIFKQGSSYVGCASSFMSKFLEHVCKMS